MKILLTALGTAGDVFPLIGVGRALKMRGHEVHLVSLEQHWFCIQNAGLIAHSITGVPGAAGHPDFYHPRRSMQLVGERMIIPAVKPVYELVSALDPAEWIVISDWFSYGARIAQELKQFRLTTCVVTPFAMRTMHRIPLAEGVAVPLPGVLSRRFAAVAGRMWDGVLAPAVNGFRRQLGLAPVRDIWYGWSLSPDRVIGLFPEWFAPRAADWPSQFVHGGFAVYDRGESEAFPREIEEGREPVVVFSAGSAGPAAASFFDAAIAASRGRRWRAVLLTGGKYRPEITLPANVASFSYVPLSRLLPFSSAIVHHGGSGTLSLALASGIPQIVIPLGHDQYDNADRLKRLGVGRTASRPRLADTIEGVLGDPAMVQRCRDLAPKADIDLALTRICNQIEADHLASRRPAAGSALSAIAS